MKRSVTDDFLSLRGLLLTAPFLLGLFMPWGSGLVSLCLCVLLLRSFRLRGSLRFSLSPLMAACLSLSLMLLLGSFYGHDRGMAPVGFVQFLPLPLFVLCLQQDETVSVGHSLERLPEAGAIMVFISGFLSLFPALQPYFMVAGRLSGFFQYPNSFALFLLLGIVILLTEGRAELTGSRLRPALLPILLAGLFFSGSRAVLALFFLFLFFIFFRGLRRHDRYGTLLVISLFTVTLTAFFVMSRFHSRPFSLKSSEFLGRLLYARDALPIILRHPFGLGYGSYQWLLGSFQTGLYSLRHVHNDYLQLLLDAGWIPGLLFPVALFSAFREAVRNVDFRRFALLSVMCFHALFDFDLQFVALDLILLVLLYNRGEVFGKLPEQAKSGSENSTAETSSSPGCILSRRHSLILFIPLVLSLSFSLLIGTASLFLNLGRADLALSLYPAYTEALITALPDSDPEQILALNSAIAPAHEEAALRAFEAGDLDSALRHCDELIRLRPLDQKAYLLQFDLLVEARQNFLSHGNSAGAARCFSLLQEIPKRMEEAKRRLSPLGLMINDQPVLRLPSDRLAQLK